MHSEEEMIVLLNEDGTVSGQAPKLASHHANTPLHLAFSCYVFDSDGKFLLTQRAHSKKVWPGVFTNTVCGHPAPGEAPEAAIARRFRDELGIDAIDNLQLILPNYRYKTPPFDGIVENEICPVYVGTTQTQPSPNPSEVETYEWVEWPRLKKRIAANPDQFSYWFKDQIPQLETHAAFRSLAKL